MSAGVKSLEKWSPSSKESLCDPIELSSSDSRAILSGSNRRMHSRTALELAGVRSLCNAEGFVPEVRTLGFLSFLPHVCGESIPILCRNLDLILSADGERESVRGTLILELQLLLMLVLHVVDVALSVFGMTGGIIMLRWDAMSFQINQ